MIPSSIVVPPHSDCAAGQLTKPKDKPKCDKEIHPKLALTKELGRVPVHVSPHTEQQYDTEDEEPTKTETHSVPRISFRDHGSYQTQDTAESGRAQEHHPKLPIDHRAKGTLHGTSNILEKRGDDEPNQQANLNRVPRGNYPLSTMVRYRE
jgi:hypothetical protein